MKLVIQRVRHASVTADGVPTGSIGPGLMILCGVLDGDTPADALSLAEKVVRMRIFTDPQDKMNLSVQDVYGSILVVSQFTLGADCRKGNRPSFIRAAKPPLSEDLYELFVQHLRELGVPVETGKFGADMQIDMAAWGPVTILLDSDELKRPRRQSEGDAT